MAVDVTVSIVNHESREGVLASLAALAADEARRSQLQVLVVDNASQDGSVEAIRSQHADVEVIARTDRGGYGANHNLALGRARGRHVLFLNDDAIVRPGAIDALVDHLDTQPEAAVAAPTIVDDAGRPRPSLWPTPSPWEDVRTAVRLGRARPLAPAGPGPHRIGWAMGCALMVRTDAARAVGGFDEGYFMYSEEVDLCVRLARSHGGTDWVPEAQVVHEGQATTGDSPERAVEMSRSRRRYQEQHYRPAGRLLARTAVSAQFAALALAARLRGRPATNAWIQAVLTWRETGRPGLRERAAAFDPRTR